MRRVLHNLDNPNDNHVQCINCAFAGNRLCATFEYIIPSFGNHWSCIRNEQNIHTVLLQWIQQYPDCTPLMTRNLLVLIIHEVMMVFTFASASAINPISSFVGTSFAQLGT